MKMLQLLPYLSEAQKKLGKTKGTILYIAISLLIILAIRYLYRSIKDSREEEKEAKRRQQDVQDLVNTTAPEDNSVSDENFKPVATNIAGRLFNAMEGGGTDEKALFEPLENLTGAQLRDVFEAFGVKEDKDLFQWFDDELNTNSWLYVVTSDSIEGCSSWFDQCSEREAMVSIWKKSGLGYN